jgi:hypothetical protein|nr:MAG TPA: Heat shock factor-binding protein 1 helix, Nucleus, TRANSCRIPTION.8A [Caudoviricetes sp.]
MFENNTLNQYSSNNQSFIGFVQNGKIFNSYGQQLGYITDEYNKAIETAKGFQQKLIEAGILVKPKTPEEINQELQETLKQTQTMMTEMSNTIISLNEKVNKLEEKKDVQQAVNPVNGRTILTTRKDSTPKSGV